MIFGALTQTHKTFPCKTFPGPSTRTHTGAPNTHLHTLPHTGTPHTTRTLPYTPACAHTRYHSTYTPPTTRLPHTEAPDTHTQMCAYTQFWRKTGKSRGNLGIECLSQEVLPSELADH